MTKTNYTNEEKIKFLLNNKDARIAGRYLYVFRPESSRVCFAKVVETIFGEEKISNILEKIPQYEADKVYFYDSIVNLEEQTNKVFYNTIKELIDKIEIKNENTLKKRAKKIRNIVWNQLNSEKYRLYKYLYSDEYANYSLSDFREIFRSDDQKERLKSMFLKYIENTDLVKRKQSKKYSVSRDMDKDTYYVTSEGKLAKIRTWLYLKHRKKCNITTDKRAVKEIAEGIIVKPMKLINKIMPKANENMKLMIASLFEGLKECTMIIDENFKKAYDPCYQSHQDTDGDKASNYSCMSYEGTRAQEFYGKINGCHVVRWETKDGEQIGRCIMYEWEGKRHFIRIYGLYPYHRTMINMLEAQMKEGDLFGRNVKLDGIKLPTTMDDETALMYLDGNRYGLREENGTWYMVADKYDIDSKTTGGETIEEMLEDTCNCEHCGRRYSTDDGYWVFDNFYCCTECAHEDGYYECERCGEWVHEDDAIVINGNYYCCETCAHNAGYEYDNYNEEWTDQDELGETDDGRYYTTKYGASDYYGVDEDEVEWDCEKYCWKRPAQEETEEQEQNEQNNENNENNEENKGEQND